MRNRLKVSIWFILVLFTAGCAATPKEELVNENKEVIETLAPAPELEKTLEQLYSEANDFPLDIATAAVAEGNELRPYSQPPVLAILMTNNSDKDIKEVTYGVLAWDKNGLPTRVHMMYAKEVEYALEFKDDDIKLAIGETTPIDRGYPMHPSIDLSDYDKVKVVVLSYEDFDGHIETNEKADLFLEKAAGQKYDWPY